LTIVLPKHASIVNAVTAGRGTVGVRVPNHPVALDLLRAFDGPVAAPSANKSNRVSPTTARHVREEFVELGDTLTVLDGGPCDVGIESTVLDLSGPVPAVLRPGAVTREMIADALRRPLSQVRDGAAVVATDTAAPSPGQHAVHYAPRTPAYRFEPGERERIDLTDAAILGVNLDAEAYARQFYARLRMLDGQGLRAIYVELPPQTAEWAAVRDRITRATRPLADERG
jgi:L-threonylcarbamoyladenylate synthase